MRKYANAALAYAVLGMVGGVFYRELTKAVGFVGTTALGAVHVHYLVLGTLAFLLILLLEGQLHFTDDRARRALVAYHVGLNGTVAMLVVRGVTQVLGVALPTAASAAVSGIAGVFHIVLGVSLVLVLLAVRRAATRAEA